MPSYRQTFQSIDAANEYEHELLAPGSYGRLLSRIERTFLVSLLKRFQHNETLEYLDFACGTGRILSELESHVNRSTGIEISEAMLSIARQRVKNSALICADITDGRSPIEAQYDLITSFRFFLNAEPSLRTAVMSKLALRLRNKDSRLVFNIHASLPSYKVLTVPVRALLARVSGRPPGFQSLSHRATVSLVRSAGLEIEEVFGYDLLSGRALTLLGPQRVFAYEQALAGSKIASRFGAHRIYVARLR